MKHILLTLIVLTKFTNSVQAGKILYARGDVKINDISAKKNASIGSGDSIQTGKTSIAVIRLNDGSKFKLNEYSKIQIEEDPDDKTSTTKAKITLGSVFINVIKKSLKESKKDKLLLKTRTASMGIRGTSFFVSYGKSANEDDVWMCVNEGIVEVKGNTEKQSTSVKAGFGVKLDKGVSTSTPQFLPWTKKLNWSMDPEIGDIENKVQIDQAYQDPLDEDYD